MNILLIDKGGYFLDFALRCQAAGHSVRWYLGKMKGGDRNPQGDGMGISKINDWTTSMRWADLIVLPDNSVYMKELGPYHRKGFPIFGPNEEAASWELDREIGLDRLEAAGVDLIPAHTFRRIAEAKAFLASNPRRFVSKLNADNDTKAMSYVSKSARDMMFMLEKWEKLGAMKGEFIFQEFVPGVEVAVGGWFGKGGFSSWFLENFEHKKLMNDDVGVNTGEMGTVMKYTENSPLAEYLLRPLEGDLYRMGYVGYIDVAVMIGKDGTPYPLEFTTRPGWPLFEIQQSLHPEPVEWMKDLLDGKDSFKPKTDIALGVVIAIPDFPFCAAPHKEKCGYPLYDWEKISERNFHPTQVMMGEAPDENLRTKPVLVTAGDCVCTISGNGPTVMAAHKHAYANVKKLELPNSPMYRTDIGMRVGPALDAVKKYKWLSDWRFE
jgi:phosphoribosylamine--glycine ligase